MVKETLVYFRTHCRFLPCIVAGVILQTILGGMSSFPSYAIAGVYIISSLFYVLKGGYSYDGKWLALLSFLPFTILVGQPHPVFNSWGRLFVFATLFLCVTPAIQSIYARRYRQFVFNAAILLCVLISYGSFVAYFLGINLFSAADLDIEEYYGVAGIFSGLTKQSMLLGPVSGLATIFLFQRALNGGNYIKWLMLIPTIGCVLFSSSRSAVGATLFGCVVLLYYKNKNGGKFVRNLLVLSMVAIFSFPVWQSSTIALQNKQAMHEGSNERFDSRSGKFEARIAEFESNPITGVGFAAFDYNGKDRFDKTKGSIEPGTSWLALLSMSGIVGFILFLRLFIASFKHVTRCNENRWLIGFLAFFTLHMVVEGYIYAGGSALAFLLWLSLGQCYESEKNTGENSLILK